MRELGYSPLDLFGPTLFRYLFHSGMNLERIRAYHFVLDCLPVKLLFLDNDLRLQMMVYQR